MINIVLSHILECRNGRVIRAGDGPILHSSDAHTTHVIDYEITQ